MRRLVKPARAAKPARDAFTFSLGGIRTIASVTLAPAIADDQMKQAQDDRGHRDNASRRWRLGRRRAAVGACS